MSSRVEQYLEEPRLLLRDRYNLLSENSSGSHSADLADHLNGMVRSGGVFSAVALLDDRGFVVDAVPRKANLLGLDLSSQPCFRHREAGAFHLSDSHLSVFTGRASVSTSIPYEAGLILGYLNLDALNDALDRTREAMRGYGMVVDGNGVVLTHPDRRQVFERVNLSAFLPVGLGLQRMQETVLGSFEGKEVLASVVPVPHSDWSVVFIADTSDAFAVLYRVRLVLVIGVGVILLVALVISGVSVKRTLSPLNHLMGMVGRVTAGDYDVTPKEDTYQEFAALSECFMDMSQAVRKREHQLRQSEERYRNIFENSVEGIFIANAGTEQLRFVNPAVCALFGYNEQDFLRLTLADIHPPKTLQSLREEFRRSGSKEGAIGLELEGIRKNGETFYADIRSGRMEIDSEEHLIAFLTDITERKRAEGIRIKLETLVEHTPNMVLMYSGSGYLQYANRAAQSILGLHDPPPEGLTAGDLHPTENREQLEQEIVPAIQKEGSWRGELAARNVTMGTVVPVEYIGFRISERGPLDSGTYAAIMVDLRDRIKAEEAYRRVVENAIEGIVVLQEGYLRFVNSAATEICGYPRDEMLQMPFIELIHPDDRPLVVNRHRRRLAGEDVPSTYPFRVLRKDGKSRWVQVNVVLIEWEERRATLNFLTDISDRFELEEQLKHAQKMEAIGTLAGGIAHDFNNILSAILGYSQIAKMKIPENAPIQEDLNQVLLAGGRAAELVQQILTFSRRDDSEAGPMLLQPVIKEAIKLIRSSLPSTIEMRKHVQETRPVMADPVQVHQILMNLCTNAFHAMERAGKGILTVRLEEVELSEAQVMAYEGLKPGAHVRLEVTDTGEGMDAAIQGRVFEPYYTTKGKGKGTGLGLAMVHGIVKQWKGHIGLRSTRGEGTTFEVLLPALEPQFSTGIQPEGLLRTGSERILCVDDEEAIVIVLQAILERMGYKVSAHKCAEDALEVLRMAPEAFDAVITDRTMPGMTGAEFSREVLRIRPDMPIVMFTGYTEGIDEPSLHRIGIRKVMMKPLTREALSDAIRSVLDETSAA